MSSSPVCRYCSYFPISLCSKDQICMSHNSLIWFIKLSNLFSSWLISCNLFVFLLQHLICPLFAVAIYQRLTVIPLPPILLMWMPAQPNPRLAVVLWGWQSLGCGAAAVLTSGPAGWLHSPAVPVGTFSGLRWDEPACSGHLKCRACPSVAPRAWQGHRSQPQQLMRCISTSGAWLALSTLACLW